MESRKSQETGLSIREARFLRLQPHPQCLIEVSLRGDHHNRGISVTFGLRFPALDNNLFPVFPYPARNIGMLYLEIMLEFLRVFQIDCVHLVMSGHG